MTDSTPKQRTLGITVLGDFILSEGVEPILDNLERANATAVACNPTVTTAADEGEGTFQPPADAGSSPRLFDRPLFGKQALWVKSAPSYHPDRKHYEDSAYAPRTVKPLTDEHGDQIRQFIDGALARGMKVYFQVGAAQPSKLRDEDRPRLPNGELPPNRMANTASLASEAVRSYNRAYVKDLLAHYPQISGFRIDWPEYPCYTLGEAFQDFSPHVQSWAEENGFDFESIQAGVLDFWNHLHGSLKTAELSQFAKEEPGPLDIFFNALLLLGRHEPVEAWQRLKLALSVDLIRDWRGAINECDDSKELVAHAFMPPFSMVTGFDFANAGDHCDVIAPKLYTMHWSLMLKFWADELMAANPGLDEKVLVQALANLMDIAEGNADRQLINDYGYPEPQQAHFIADETQRRKIRQAIESVKLGTSTPVCAMAHGYGPLDDFAHRFGIAAESECQIVWINRYGYLSDDKLDAIGDIWSRAQRPG